MNALAEYLDEHPKLRKRLYILQGLVTLGWSVVAFVLTSMSKSPQWFVITAGCLNIIWAYLGMTAQGHVKVPDDDGPAPNQD